MAQPVVLTNANVKVNGVDLSAWTSEVSLDMTLNAVEVTAMGAGGKQFLQGLEESKIDLTFWQDYAASAVHATLLAVRNGGTATTIQIIPNGTAVSATNPRLTAVAVITDYPILAGKVGDGLSAKVSFVVSGTVTSATV